MLSYVWLHNKQYKRANVQQFCVIGCIHSLLHLVLIGTLTSDFKNTNFTTEIFVFPGQDIKLIYKFCCRVLTHDNTYT